MNLNLGKEIAALKRLGVQNLRTRYGELFGEQTGSRNKTWLLKRLAWRLQALAEGNLSDRARQRAAELANDADLRLGPPPTLKPRLPAPAPPAAPPRRGDRRLPLPGTILTRRYKGQTLQVRVLLQGFEFENVVYASLSAVAKAITGSHCNGFLFFRLTEQGATP